MRTINTLVLVAIGVLMFTHAAFAEAPPKTDEEFKAVGAAQELIAKVYPKFKPGDRILVIDDRDGRWFITYRFPKPTPGGAPVIWVEKNTYRVLDYTHTQ